jgi:hypothetical protein
MKIKFQHQEVFLLHYLGLNDLRLGVSSSDQKCQTCGETR